MKALRFVLLAYAITWTVAGVLYAAGIRYGSVTSIVLIALLYMPAPAFAALILNRRALRDYQVTLRGVDWKWLVITTLGFVAFIVAGTFAVIAILGNGFGIEQFGRVDFSEASVLGQVRSQVPGGRDIPVTKLPFPMSVLFLFTVVQGIIGGATINMIFAMGEELGWRGLLLDETKHLGFVRSNVLIGTVWGLWHAPIILQGHNFREHTVAGVFVMTLFCIAMSFPLAYSRIKSRTLFAPAALHGMLNALGGLTVLFVARANPLYGFVAGFAGIAVTSLLAIAVSRRR